MPSYVFYLMRKMMLEMRKCGATWRLFLFKKIPAAALLAVFSLSALMGRPVSSSPSPAQPCIAGSPEYATMNSRWVVPDVPMKALREAPALLTVPQGWGPGCSAAVLTWEGVEPSGPRLRLVQGLIEQGLAVLELDVSTPFGLSADSGRVPTLPPSPTHIIPLLFGALRELRVEGAGTVIALGFGLGGASGLEAAALSAARAEGFTAAGELGPGGSFRLGRTTEVEQWPAVATRVCRIVAIATRLPTSCLADWITLPSKAGVP